MSVSRAYYLDAAKVISACMVVYWHTVFTDARINEVLLPLRMPLFFLVSGFFAGKAMQLEWGEFISRKFLQLVYLYVVWSVLLYFTLEMLIDVLKGVQTSPAHLLAIFIDPPRTIWFLYALALAYLVGYVTWRLPRHLIVPTAFAVYFLPDILLRNATDGDLTVRLCRLVPFFLLALRYRSELRSLVESRRFPGFLCAAFYFPLALLTQQFAGVAQAVLFLAASVVGISGMLNILWRLEDRRIVRRISGFGSVTIFIFLLHRYPVTACNFLAAKLGIAIDPWLGAVVATIAVVTSVLVGRHLVRPYLPWLERPLWNSVYRKSSRAS